ncbi:hypothetical protein A3B35_02805 [Candidatus Kaiserbacteria bacterium RIFCSPLOWO2_01_FULL_54_24]|uniref:Uncharacterized protein n=1 Tax=Candidatus Kaiserbacteria bacterium RIFCSPLOWO2_01_FULL_54_24 TaxID=1798515 RepID=A0A1F6EWH2_9BACT|nr:MAG: hypothetical protein A3B35_02805 [Candidatus Kaiserbacteria bacterium RIFCSPLOWO2_01_FULL_54_24]
METKGLRVRRGFQVRVLAPEPLKFKMPHAGILNFSYAAQGSNRRRGREESIRFLPCRKEVENRGFSRSELLYSDSRRSIPAPERKRRSCAGEPKEGRRVTESLNPIERRFAADHFDGRVF